MKFLKIALLVLVSVIAVLVIWQNKSRLSHDDSHHGASGRVVCEEQGVDIEGCATLIGPNVFYAGQSTQFMIEYTVGPSGLPVGGGVSIGLHHSDDIKTQIKHSFSANYVWAEVQEANQQSRALALKKFLQVPQGMFENSIPGLFDNSIYHKLLIANIVNSEILAGSKIRFYFGSGQIGIKMPESSIEHNEFRVTVDNNADGVFNRIAKQPRIHVLHATPKALAASIPSQAVINSPFDATIRLEDQFYNVVENFSGKISVFNEHDQIIASDIVMRNGIVKTRLTLTTQGHHRLRLKTHDGQYLGRSNPVRVFSETPKRKLYFGDLHGHTGISDGLGRSVDSYFAYGRDVADVDFVALTDHGHFDWPGNIRAVQSFHDEGEYVTLLAQEAGSGPNHMNLYFRRDNTEHMSQWQNEFRNFQSWILNQYNSDGQQEVMTGPHHFAYERGQQADDLYPFGLWDDKVARFVEVYSSHGTSEFLGNPRPLPVPSEDESKYMQAGLAKGLKFAVIGASDNHDSKPGRSQWGHYAGGLSGIWADELSRESLWQSVWNRDVFATSADRIYLDFSLKSASNESHRMGRIVSNKGELVLNAYIIGKTDKLDVVIIRDNQEIYNTRTSNGLIELNFTDNPEVGEHFYYLRVSQDNGERAWSTPIWVSQG